MQFAKPPPLSFPSGRILKGMTLASLHDLVIDDSSTRCQAIVPLKFNIYQGPSPQKDAKKTRASFACFRCKEKRVACNGRKPCKACLKTSTDCTYPQGAMFVTEGGTPTSVSRMAPAMSEEILVQPSSRFPKKESRNTEASRLSSHTTMFHFVGTELLDTRHSPPHPRHIGSNWSTTDLGLTLDDQVHLIQLYSDNVNPYFPIPMNKASMIDQLFRRSNELPVYMSPLFFTAIFAHAASLLDDPTDSRALSAKLLDQAVTLAHMAINSIDPPSIDTVLALLIMANHCLSIMRRQDLVDGYYWARKAFHLLRQLGLDNGTRVDNEYDWQYQLGLRALWTAFITDRTISVTLGQPFTFEESDLGTSVPVKLKYDDDSVCAWLDNLQFMITQYKVAGRVIRFNYYPLHGESATIYQLHSSGFLATSDSWLALEMCKLDKRRTDNPPNTMEQRSANFKTLFLLTNLILLHKPYMDSQASSTNKGSSSSSLDVCTHAATIITRTALNLPREELIYLSRFPSILYALMVAMYTHVFNSTPVANQSKRCEMAKLLFEKGFTCLQTLPLNHAATIVPDMLKDLEQAFSRVQGHAATSPSEKMAATQSFSAGGPDLNIRHATPPWTFVHCDTIAAKGNQAEGHNKQKTKARSIQEDCTSMGVDWPHEMVEQATASADWVIPTATTDGWACNLSGSTGSDQCESQPMVDELVCPPSYDLYPQFCTTDQVPPYLSEWFFSERQVNPGENGLPLQDVALQFFTGVNDVLS